MALIEENVQSYFIPYEREMFRLSDGAAIAIDWYEKIPAQDDKRPLLICVGNLGGYRQSSQLKSVIKAVSAKGFKIAFVRYRGTGGVPITTGKLYSIKEWRDVKEPADYLFK